MATIASLLAIAGWIAYPKSAVDQEHRTDTRVKTVLTKETSASGSIAVAGFVQGQKRADIAPAASGKIVRIFKHEGDQVKQGDVVATIEADRSDAQIGAAQASIKALEKTLSTSEDYYGQLIDQTKGNPESDANDEAVKSARRARDLQTQIARSQLIAAQGALAIAQAGKKDFSVTAPFSGTVTSVHGREGGFANFSLPLISLSTPDNLEIEVYVSAKSSRDIAEGNIFLAESSDDTSVSGIVTAVSPGSDPQTSKTLVRIRIDDPEGNIRLGDFLRGYITIPRSGNTLSIPENAIVSRGGDPVVFIVDEHGIAAEQAVRTSDARNGFVEIIEGLAPDQNIVIEGQQYLVNGSHTRPYAER